MPALIRQARALRPQVLACYAVALVAAGAALDSVLVAGARGVPTSLLLFLAAITLTSRYGGWQAALPVAVVAVMMNLWFAAVSLITATVPSLLVGLQVAAFALVAASIIVFNHQRLRASKELRHHARFIDAMTSDPDEGICALDGVGDITSVNAAAERILGQSAAALEGVALHGLLHGADDVVCEKQGTECPLQRMLRPGSSVQTGEVDATPSGRDRLRLACTASPILVDGKPRGTVLTMRDVTDHSSEVETLRESEGRYRRLVEAAPDGIVVVDSYGYITGANRAAALLYGHAAAQDLTGRRQVELVTPDDRARLAEESNGVLAGSAVGSGEYRGLRHDGSTFPSELRMSATGEEDGAARSLILICRDVSERRHAEASAHAAHARVAIEQAIGSALSQSVTLGDATFNVLQAICLHAGWDIGAIWMPDSSDGTLRCHTQWHVPSLEPAGFDDVTQQLALNKGDGLPGRVWASGAPLWVTDVRSEPGFSRALMATKAGLHTDVCIPILVGSSVRAVLECLSREIRDESPEMVAAMASIAARFAHFIERKDAEIALHFQARHDALTGLPNRVLLQERIERALVVARSQHQPLALLLMDLDRFKEVNDTLGHHHGDLLLQQVGSRLRTALRDSDTVARLGGDEFSVLLPNTDVVNAGLVATKILNTLQQPYQLETQLVDVGASIGIALFPDQGDDGNTLLQKADVAMYAAKRSRTGYVVYAAEQDDNDPGRLTFMADLRQAIEQERITVYYQPKANFRTGRIDSVEALARWHHPEHGLIFPDQFIPLAEQSGLIKPLSYCVLNQALRQCKMWRRSGLDLAVAVNLSVENLHDPRLVQVVSELLATHALDAGCLMVEITETAIMLDSARAIETLSHLHHMGVRVALDDFGTGYSALTYLKRLPVDQIKIDKSFVMEMVEHDDDAFIAQAVIDLGHNLGIEVVAEGVMSQEAWRALNTMGCDHAQGFYLSKPLPAADLSAWLDALSASGQASLLPPRARQTGA